MAHRGDAGFGYDPLFLVDGFGKSMAELAPDEKNAVSHRRRAFDSFLKAVT
jgi:XTP/dITP diphosphohydrolase